MRDFPEYWAPGWGGSVGDAACHNRISCFNSFTGYVRNTYSEKEEGGGEIWSWKNRRKKWRVWQIESTPQWQTRCYSNTLIIDIGAKCNICDYGQYMLKHGELFVKYRLFEDTFRYSTYCTIFQTNLSWSFMDKERDLNTVSKKYLVEQLL